MERSGNGNPTTIDLLMCGNGQNGGLGNNIYTNSQGNPVRVRNVSGLQQCEHSILSHLATRLILLSYCIDSDKTKQLEPIRPTEVIISPTGHVLVALNSSVESDGVGGQDLMVWGKNFDYELGSGKKSSSPIPVTLEAPDGERLMLMKKKARVVMDLDGKQWKRGVVVEQRPVAGYGNNVVYWKIAI